MKKGFVVVAAGLLLALVPGAAHAGTLDQQNTGPRTGSTEIFGPGVEDPGGALSVAQTFTADLTGKLDQLDISVGRSVTLAHPLTVQIRNVVNGAPGDSVLASAFIGEASSVAAWIAVPFSSPATVFAGTQYAIVLFTQGSSVYFADLSTSDSYPRGSAFNTRGQWPPSSSWSEINPGYDLLFKTYVVRDSTLVAEPAIASILPGLRIYLTLSARLTAGGVAQAGQTIRFLVGGTTVCSAKTGADGVARCGNTLPILLATALRLGYDALFDGSPDLQPSSAHGPILQLGGIRLF